jgi:hypothetical protein
VIKAFAILLVTVIAARADVAFVGVSSGSEGSYFVVANSDTKSESGWLKIGDSFEGSTILSYDKNADILIVRSGERTLRLKLRPSVIADVRQTTKLNSKEAGIQIFSKRVSEAKGVIRVLAQAKDGRWVFTCIEVWKANDNSPKVGAVTLGLPLFENENSAPHEALLWLSDSGSVVGGRPSSVGCSLDAWTFPRMNCAIY